MSSNAVLGKTPQEVNDLVELKLKEPRVKALMKQAKDRYRNRLNEHDRESAANWALCRACKSHRDDHPSDQKFETTLFHFLKWEMNRVLLRESKHSRVYTDVDLDRLPDNRRTDGLGVSDSLKAVFEMGDQFLPAQQWNTITRHLFGGMTYEEIANEDSSTYETVRRNYDGGIRRLRELCRADYFEGEPRSHNED